jgi:hypothetical protein
MRTIMEDYHAGKSTVTYPERIKSNVHAQAFYGVLNAIFDEVENEIISADFVAEVAEEITKIIAAHSQVDWTNNKTIHDRISQDIDDLFYEYEKERGLEISFDIIEQLNEIIIIKPNVDLCFIIQMIHRSPLYGFPAILRVIGVQEIRHFIRVPFFYMRHQFGQHHFRLPLSFF